MRLAPTMALLAILAMTVVSPMPGFAETVAPDSTKPNWRTEYSAGIIFSDIGGGEKIGPAIGFIRDRELWNRWILFRLGMEYSLKGGAGQVGHQQLSTGEILYQGQADISLHYLQTTVSVGCDIVIGEIDIIPYFGLAPALLVIQTIDLVGPAQDGAFEDYRSYSSVDVLALAGVSIRYSPLVFDCQFANGLLDLEASGDGLDGSSLGGSTLIYGNSTSRSVRFAMGVIF